MIDNRLKRETFPGPLMGMVNYGTILRAVQTHQLLSIKGAYITCYSDTSKALEFHYLLE